MTDEQWVQLIMAQRDMAQYVYLTAVSVLPAVNGLNDLRATVTSMTTALQRIEGKVDQLSEIALKEKDMLSQLSNELDNLGQRWVGIATRLAQAETLEEAQSNINTIAQMVSRVREIGATETNPIPNGVIPAAQPLPNPVPDDMAHLIPTAPGGETATGTSQSGSPPGSGILPQPQF